MACIHVVTTTNEGSINSLGPKGDAVPTSPLTLTERSAESPFHSSVQKHLNFNVMPPTIMECKDEEKRKSASPQHPLDDEVWLKEPILERDLCIHMS